MDTWNDVARAIQAHPAGAWLHGHLTQPPAAAERVRVQVASRTLPGGGAYILVDPPHPGAWRLALADCLEVARAVLQHGSEGTTLRLHFDEGKASMGCGSPQMTIPTRGESVAGHLVALPDLGGAVAPVLPGQLGGLDPAQLQLEHRRLSIEELRVMDARAVSLAAVDNDRLNAVFAAHNHVVSSQQATIAALLATVGKLADGQSGGQAAAFRATVDAMGQAADARVAAAKAEAEAAAASMGEGEAVQLAAIEAVKEAVPVLGLVLRRAMGGPKKKGERKEEPKKEEAGAPPPPPAAEEAPAAKEAPAAPGDLLGPLLLLLLDEQHEEHKDVREEFRAALARLTVPQLMAVGQRIQALAMEGR